MSKKMHQQRTQLIKLSKVCKVSRMYHSICAVLSRFNLDSVVIENFAGSSIIYNQFAALDNDDLLSLGVTDSETRDEMLAEFKILDVQEVYFSA
jgi:hypothetical protein